MKLKNTRRHAGVSGARWEKPPVPDMAITGIKLKKLLVPVDFSELSRKALQYAVSFARLFKAQIFLLHVVEMMPAAMPGLVAEGVMQGGELREQAAKHLALWRRAAEAQAPAKSGIEEGNPAEVIARFARENEVDMVIMATHGRAGLERLLLGGTAKKVMRLAPCPVLVVREREHDFLTPGEKQPAKRAISKPARKRHAPSRRSVAVTS